MPVYQYKAKNIRGKDVKGTLTAADQTDLMEQLRRKQLYLLDFKEQKRSAVQGKLKAKQLVDFNYQLGSMLHSGVSMVRSFEIMVQSDIKPKEREIYQALLDQLVTGVALSDAMTAMGRTFPELLINMFRAGEANGTIDKTAMEMSNHYEKEYKLRSKINSATAYPKLLGVLLIVVLVGIFNLIMPRFLGIYGDMELPKITQVMVSVSKLFTDYLLYTAIVVLALVLGISVLAQARSFKLAVDKAKVTAPVLGKLMRTVYTARFSRTLSSLYASGLTILNCLEVARNTIGNVYIESQFDDVIASVRTGSTLSAALNTINGFDKKLSLVVLVGEESGQLDQMLLNIADSFDYEAARSVDKMTSVLEPALIVFMAAIIAFVIISVMLPIYSMYSAIDSTGMAGV